MKKVLVTGSAGLIGSEATRFFCSQGFKVIGIDNNMRAYFFGDDASTDWNRKLLEQQYKNYKHHNLDIRNEKDINALFAENKFDLIIHTAAQPSHDWAAKEPLTDFSVNATGTLILLEAFRKYCPEAVFIFTSTNKVYGDTPNRLPLVELATRYEIDPDHAYSNGIDEGMTIDNSKHSIFGASKVAADVLVQEYGKYFDLRTGVFRGGCLTGPAHSGTQLHGFLAYLVKCIAEGRKYTIFGYKGKQVRDNIHSSDLIAMFYEFYKNPRIGEVYNAGGARFSNVSMMEAIEKIEAILGRKGNIGYTDVNRSGDHMWYVSNVDKFKDHYPSWDFKYDIDATLTEICELGHFSKPEVGKLIVSKIGVASTPQVFVSAHVAESYGPVQALKAYLIKNYSSFIFVEHPFTYASIAGSNLDLFRGSLVSKRDAQRKINNDLIAYVKDFALTFYWFLKRGRGSKVFIGVNPLNAIVGVVLKKVGFDFKLVYYSVDYSTQRFESSLLNKIYQFIDTKVVKNADFVWNTSERMLDIREGQGASESLFVPNGVHTEKLVSEKRTRKDKNTLVIVDHLTDSKGVELVIKALKKLKKLNPKVRLVIIGFGPQEPALKRLATKLKVADSIEFRGALRPNAYLGDLGKYGIGLCVHRGKKHSNTYYSDPIPPKEFLAAGLPVIVSKSLWLSDDIEKEKLGISIRVKEKELLEAVKTLWSKRAFYAACSKNAKEYTKDLSWDATFDKVFKKLAKKITA